jgi:urocanate hydratase
MTDRAQFRSEILEGIPDHLPEMPSFDPHISRAPARKDILNQSEKKLAIHNALRYFDPKHHARLASEFATELKTFGRIYMHRLRPHSEIKARPLSDYPFQCEQAGAIMVMLQNNLDPRVAQHPYELITYGGNGSVFQNWAQYRLTMKYLATMTDQQTLVLYSGHPMGLFPSHKRAPRVVVTNGMMIPNYSKPNDLEKFNALGVTQYGQMTAGSFMYIGPQGIVHGTTITLLGATRNKMSAAKKTNRLPIFVSSGLGGMSGAQGKASVIAKVVGIIAEINPLATQKRLAQGWINEVYDNTDALLKRALQCAEEKIPVALAYQGNVVDLWEAMAKAQFPVDIGSDQTSLHNPFGGGYYPAGLTLMDSQKMMAHNPEEFAKQVKQSLLRHAVAIQKLTQNGMYFFDYGNAFLLEAGRAGAPIQKTDGTYIYPTYVQDIMGPYCFDFGFGPFRWVCASGDEKDLATTDKIAGQVLREIASQAPDDIRQQLNDNISWIEQADQNKMVVGSQARILYADALARVKIAEKFNDAIKDKLVSGPIVLGRDHHDVSGTDSPFRETSNIYDGSQFTSDMAVQNFVGDSFRGATWVSLHNGGGVGWGEVINGGFGLVLDGTPAAQENLRSMLHWDVYNGIARRAWARNENAITAIQRGMDLCPEMQITKVHLASDELIDRSM